MIVIILIVILYLCISFKNINKNFEEDYKNGNTDGPMEDWYP